MENLKKEIGFFGAFSTVVGVVIGSGVFFKAAVIYKTTGNVSLGLLAWILAGIISICAGLTTAELAAAIPETGGMIVWVEKAYGKTISYLLGWAQAIIYYPASIAAAAAIFSTQFLNLFGVDKKYSRQVVVFKLLQLFVNLYLLLQLLFSDYYNLILQQLNFFLLVHHQLVQHL